MKKIKKSIVALILGLVLSFTIIIANKIETKADTITDLTGYTWEANNIINFYNWDELNNYNINFISNNNNYIIFGVDSSPDDDLRLKYYINSSNNIIVYDESQVWLNPAYKTIQITGGTDTTNSTLIAWLEANGTLTPPEPEEYTLILNGNGGRFLIIQSQTYENAISGTATAGSFYNELERLLQLATISRTGYQLLGWNTDSSATTALSQAEINALSGNTTLYAIWGRICVVTFYPNGATSGTTPDNIEVLEGTTITLPGNTGGLARSGFNFVGWARNPYATTTITTATIYNVDTRMYAIWQPINRYMNLKINVNNINVYKADIFKETGNFYDITFEVEENGLLGIVFSNINYLRDPEADSEYILMSYADRLVLSMLTNDVTTIGIYQSGYLVESGTVEQWRDYFSTHGSFEMGFYDQGDINIEITTQDTGDLGRFKAIVATAVTSFQVLFDLRLGWITIGGIISIVLTISIVFFIFKVVKGGGN